MLLGSQNRDMSKTCMRRSHQEIVEISHVVRCRTIQASLRMCRTRKRCIHYPPFVVDNNGIPKMVWMRNGISIGSFSRNFEISANNFAVDTNRVTHLQKDDSDFFSGSLKTLD